MSDESDETLELLSEHDMNRKCICGLPLEPWPAVDTVAAFERCDCSQGVDAHLVEIRWHRKCFIALST